MSLQTMMTGLVFALPSGILRMMAGGAVTADGKTLDPRIALMAAQAKRGPALTTLPVDQARAGMDAGLGLIAGPRAAGVTTEDLTVPGSGGAELPARLYRPGGNPRSLILYFHQGGCVLGNLSTCDVWCSQLAKEAGTLVLSVEYRKAPEHKFPTPIDDAIAAYEWAAESKSRFGVEKVAVAGDSAGGYLSAVICLSCKRKGLPQPAAQILIYPCVDWSATDGTMKTMANAYPLTADMMAWFGAHLFEPDASRLDWKGSPALASEHDGLAPALIYNAGFDPLTSQGAAYAEKLKAAGVSVTYKCFDALSHSFTAMGNVVPAAKAALSEVAADARRALA